MRFRTRRLAVLLVGLSVAACAAACGSSGDSAAPAASSGPLAGIKLVNPGYLTVALIDGNLPSIAVGPNSTLIGADGAWVQQAAKDLGLKIKTFPTTLSGQILAVNDGKADIGTSTHYTAERAKQIYYTFPWSISRTGVITKKGFNYTGPDSFQGKTTGTETGLDYVPYMQKTYGQGNVRLYGSVAQLNDALDNGQIVGEVSGYQSFLTYKAKYPDFEWHFLKVGQLGLPQSIVAVTSHNFVKCDNQKLADALNKTLQKMQNDGSRKAALVKYGDTSDAASPPALQAPKELCSA
jgi:ABC-type amino acid transport substrate-binding protein